MKTCTQTIELTNVFRAGQWPHGCAAELSEHVASCAHCTEQLQILSAFTAAREGAMRCTPPQSADLLWWKAQLRRRHEAMERLERPGLAIPLVSILASVVILGTVLATAWKHIDWSRLATAFTPAARNGWIVAAFGLLLCGFVVAAVMVGLGLPEERS